LTQPLPDTRTALLTLHALIRRRRDQAALGGPDYRQACQEIAEIEVQIARIEVPAPAAAKPTPGAPAQIAPAQAPAPIAPAAAKPAPGGGA
jgi:hypothetical protein